MLIMTQLVKARQSTSALTRGRAGHCLPGSGEQQHSKQDMHTRMVYYVLMFRPFAESEISRHSLTMVTLPGFSCFLIIPSKMTFFP